MGNFGFKNVSKRNKIAMDWEISPFASFTEPLVLTLFSFIQMWPASVQLQ